MDEIGPMHLKDRSEGRCGQPDLPPPLVSIIINNYNYSAFLGAAIESALAQTYRPIELIVVDDGSTDSSREVIAGYVGRILPVLKENGGQASAFNAGFAASKGDILCFLDADDLFLPEKVSTVVRIFEENPQAGWCFDQVQEFNDKTAERYAPTVQWRSGAWDERATVAASHAAPHLPTATSGLSFKRCMLTAILPMPEIVRITSDSYLKLAAVGLEPGWMAVESLTLQRIHGENAYTHRRVGKRPVMALTGLVIGIGLYEQIPTLRGLAITTFSRGLGLAWLTGVSHNDSRHLASTFLRKMTVATKAKIVVKATYCSVRTVLSDFKQGLKLAKVRYQTDAR
jgi:hypothetical protein